MDEIWFHVERRFELIQIWGSELLQLIEAKCLEIAASTRVIAARQALVETQLALRSIGHEVSEKIVRLSDPEYLFEWMSNSIGLDFNRATLYALGFGFTIGSSLGLVIGICLQSPKQPSILMRSIGTYAYMGRNSVVLMEDALVPRLIRQDQVLIEVKYAALDFMDVWISCGYGRTIRCILGNDFPLILGLDGSGVIVEIGSSVTELEIGTPVFFAGHYSAPGALAEYVLMDHRDVAPLPPGVGFEAAASLASPGVSAWMSVTVKAGLSVKNAHESKILIHCLNSSSSSSWMILQLCAAFRAGSVTVTCPVRWSTTAKTLGANSVLTLESGQVQENSFKNRYDIVFNTIGTVAHEFCASMTSSNGKVIDAFDPELKSDDFGFVLRRLYGFWLRSLSVFFNKENWRASHSSLALHEVSKLMSRRFVRPFIDTVYAPEEIDTALVKLDSAMGRTLIRMEPRRKNGYTS